MSDLIDDLKRRRFLSLTGAFSLGCFVPKIGFTQGSSDFTDFDCSTIIPLASRLLKKEGASGAENSLVEPAEGLSPEGTVRRRLRWRASDGLTKNTGIITLGIDFIGNPGDAWKRAVEARAKTWLTQNNGELGKKIVFKFGATKKKSQIRIQRTGVNGLDPRNNSRVGRSALNVTNPDRETMNIYNLDSVPHEFGHALGLVHEHTNPGRPVTLLKNKTIQHYYDKYGWSASTTKNNLFYVGERCLSDPAYNPVSVMGYTIPAEITKEKLALLPGKKITARDLRCAVSLYEG